MKAAAARPEPIPFYAEMSSVNPVFILPGILQSQADTIAKNLHASATLGMGQFCTQPGIVITLDGSESFVLKFTELMLQTAAGVLLNRNISSAYQRAMSERPQRANITLKTATLDAPASSAETCSVRASVLETDAASWLADPVLHEEVFGPSTLLVHASGREDLLRIAREMKGNLTATILGTEEELADYADLAKILEQKVGRVLFNSYPTGVEVCEAMVHGGPFPATSDGRSTSVCGRAILRFTRPVCFQNFPDSALPAELQQANPLKIWRMEDRRYIQG